MSLKIIEHNLLWSIGLPFSFYSSKSISQFTSATKTDLKIFSSLSGSTEHQESFGSYVEPIEVI